MICVPFSLNFSCCTERQVSRDKCCQESSLPPLLSGIYVLSRRKFILYIDHLEALRGNNNNQQTEPGLLNWIYYVFFLLKDPLIGPNQNLTVTVAESRPGRQYLSVDPLALLWRLGKNFSPDRLPMLFSSIWLKLLTLLSDAQPGFKGRKEREMKSFCSVH